MLYFSQSQTLSLEWRAVWLSAVFLVQCRLRSPFGKAAESLTALGDTLRSLQQRMELHATTGETVLSILPLAEMARIRNDRACALRLLAFVDAFEKLLHAAHSGTAYALPSFHSVPVSYSVCAKYKS